jgi:outer membrane protein assembly factor BamE
MLKRFTCFLVIIINSCFFVGCSSSIHKSELYAGKIFGIHKIDIPQGNIIADENIKKIKYGMTKAQVVYILGSPVLNKFFDNNKLMYIAFTQEPYSDPEHENLILEFKDNSLVKITREKFDAK